VTLDVASEFAPLRQLRVDQHRWGSSLLAERTLGRAPFREDGFHFLPPGLPLLHCQGLTIQREAVGGGQAAYERFPETKGRVDDYLVSRP
jgi:hypothetical protein